MRIILVFCFGFLITAGSVSAQRYIRNIYFDKRDVFDSTQQDWFWGGSLVNSLHTLTCDYVIEDELLFKEGDELIDDVLDETERNLRRTSLFTNVRMLVDSVSSDSVDVTIRLQDKWSTAGAILFGTGGGISNYGASFEEQNFAGWATQFGGAALYRTENDIGWQGSLYLSQRRLFRSEYTLLARIFANRIRTEQSLSIEKPYRTLQTPSAYFLSGINNFGDDFLYTTGTTPALLPYHIKRLNAMYSHAAGRGDRYYASLLVSVEDIHRIAPQFRQAYDNSARILFSLGSLRQDFIQRSGVNGYEIEDIPIGAWGMAVLGYTLPMNSDGERLYYVGAQAQQSELFHNENVYLWGHLEAASAFGGTVAKYTYLESAGIGHWRLSPHYVLAARFRQQTSWNWTAFRQLVLDNDAGLRGYAANALAGENRIITNVEFRVFPSLQVWFFRTSATLFYDAGTVWQQSGKIMDARVHHAAGIGLRIHNTKASGGSAILRFDLAYNFDTRSVGFVFSSDQLFSAFGKHSFKSPYIFGSAIDVE